MSADRCWCSPKSCGRRTVDCSSGSRARHRHPDLQHQQQHGARALLLRERAQTDLSAHPRLADDRLHDLAHPPAADALGRQPGPSGQPDRRFGSDGSGLDPGAIPPVPPGFEGELKCVQVDASGTPFGGNNLKGEAVIRSRRRRRQQAQRDRDPRQPGSRRRRSGQRAAPRQLGAQRRRVQLLPEHAGCSTTSPTAPPIPSSQTHNPDLVRRHRRRQCPIRTYLTLVPCIAGFRECRSRRSVTVQFAIVNEFEQVFSASTTVDVLEDDPPGRHRCADRLCCSRRRRSAACTTTDSASTRMQGFCDKNERLLARHARHRDRLHPHHAGRSATAASIGVAEEVHYNNLRVEPTTGPVDRTAPGRRGTRSRPAIASTHDRTWTCRAGRWSTRSPFRELLIGSASEQWCSRPAVRKGD